MSNRLAMDDGGLIVIVMGVSGSGKTTVGRKLAEKLRGRFLDADDFHPAQNVAKMTSGVPLDDSDRWPWLHALGNEIRSQRKRVKVVIVACSALKSSYREELRRSGENVTFVHLSIDPDTASQRLSVRRDHFMPAALVDSQFRALEEPRGAITVDASQSVQDVVEEVISRLGC